MNFMLPIVARAAPHRRAEFVQAYAAKQQGENRVPRGRCVFALIEVIVLGDGLVAAVGVAFEKPAMAWMRFSEALSAMRRRSQLRVSRASLKPLKM
ncbi:MAG: hypothetical protein ACI9R3_003365 [Verrucomicrobiales bacterium]|jgi:hypothetical protein